MARRAVPHVTEAEWVVMGVVWAAPGAVTANEVVERLAGRKEWNPRTIKTLLNRLVKKGALGFEAEGKRYLYRAMVRREECVWRESESFVSRVFGGRAGEMLCRFVDEAELSREEIEELKKVLERKGR
jgi:BlaI family penicillinase repressor